jgi:hypothetical protein
VRRVLDIERVWQDRPQSGASQDGPPAVPPWMARGAFAPHGSTTLRKDIRP